MKNKTVLIIPAYEPSHNFVDYAKELMSRGFSGIVVVNDGSCEKYDSIFDELSAIPSCHVISYKENRGKGYALKTAFKYCLTAYDSDYVFVTADCDGQHLCSDVEKVAYTAYEHPSKLILGSRDFSQEQVPARSKAGNVNIRKLFKFFYALSLNDTQTGLRAFSYALLEKLISIKGSRFEYEMNMLIVFHKSHIGILEVPISTVYLEKEEDVEKVSHFKTFSDSVRVTATLFQNLGWYAISSVISVLIDMGAFFLLSTYVFISSDSIAYNVLLATAGARILSSIVNFTLNFKLVFNGQSKKSIIKYYILWACQLTLSYFIALFWSSVFSSTVLSAVTVGLLTTVLKSLCDLLVSVGSYQLQSRWVFVSAARSRVYFYGTFFRIFRHFYALFKKRYESFVIPDETKPEIYICNGSAADNLLKVAHSLKFDLHPALLDHLLGYKRCIKHFSSYTFTKKKGRTGLKKFLGRIEAFFAALVFVPLAKALRAVSVSENIDEVNRYSAAMKYLLKNENIIIFVGQELSEYEKDKTIDGILSLGKSYCEAEQAYIVFNILNIDAAKGEILETDSFKISNSDNCYEDVKNEILSRLV